jgi:hypothetical protein
MHAYLGRTVHDHQNVREYLERKISCVSKEAYYS